MMAYNSQQQAASDGTTANAKVNCLGGCHSRKHGLAKYRFLAFKRSVFVHVGMGTQS